MRHRGCVKRRDLSFADETRFDCLADASMPNIAVVGPNLANAEQLSSCRQCSPHFGPSGPLLLHAHPYRVP